MRCAFGCGEFIPADELEVHEETLCTRRVEPCRLGCGMSVRLDRAPSHEKSECGKRVVVCPFDCDDTVRAEAVDEHAITCGFRTVPCGADSEACRRQLRSWVTGDLFNGRGRCVVCEAHGETALTWAANHGELAVARTVLGQTGGVGIAHETKDGHTSLTRACYSGQLEMVEFLMDAGAEPNFETARCRTPLLEACRQGHLPVVE